MRLIFLGSPESVIAPLTTILEKAPLSGHEVVAVVSQPARPMGRSHQPVDPPVASFAKSRGLRVFQPEKASDPEFLDALQALRPDVMITAAYGQILSDAFLAIPRRATINIHPSLLPRYRGATPVPAALLDGCSTTGVSVLFTVAKLDAGAMIEQLSCPIKPDETAGELTARLFSAGGDLTLAALEKLADPGFKGRPQDDTAVTYCRKIQKTAGQVRWDDSATAIYNRYRAFEPWPGSYSFCQGRRINLTDIKPNREEAGANLPLGPGDVLYDKRQKCLLVGTGSVGTSDPVANSSGLICIFRLKPAGSKEIDAAAFWNGLKDKTHVQFVQDET